MQLPIYMDCHSTTPVDARVLGAMLPYFNADFGNAASRTHSFGWAAEAAVDRAREQVAALLGATAREIVFTSGATESNALALCACNPGVSSAQAPRTSATEWPSISTTHPVTRSGKCSRLCHS